MERYSEVVGLPVISLEDGKRIGIIKDVLFCPEFRETKAFLMERRGYRIAQQVILLTDVLNVGRDAVVVNDCKCLQDLRKANQKGYLKSRGRVNGLRIYTRKGQDIGIVKDVLFDYKTGFIEGVEVSDGLLQDLVQGRNVLPLIGKVEFAKDNILVDNEAIEEMMNNGGGLKNLLSKDESD